jgi:predicted DNA-binding transcriptional regulator AlpA
LEDARARADAWKADREDNARKSCVSLVSDSTVKRMVVDGRFPKPMRISARRIGWPARDVKAWIRQLDDQRRALRQ